MRTEKEIFELLLDTAAGDGRIRAVILNGSRTNPNAPKDIFQDYDIVYVVNETASFINDKEWINRFGEILFMQYPDESPYFPSEKELHYGWLMQFSDGVRIDLTVQTVEYARENITKDSLCAVLLDKDGCLPPVPAASDASHRVKRPTAEQFASTCNEFWWCLGNAAKGLWRYELTYVQDMLNFVVRKQLERMLSWKVGALTEYSASVGKSAKYMHRWLPADEWESYLSTYSAADTESLWEAIGTMCALFGSVSAWVAGRNGFELDEAEARGCKLYLDKIRKLPQDAESIM